MARARRCFPIHPAGRRMQWKDSASHLEPADRDALRFDQRGGMLRNILAPQVPTPGRATRRTAPGETLAQQPEPVASWPAGFFIPGGRDVLPALRERLSCPNTTFAGAKPFCANMATSAALPSFSFCEARSPTACRAGFGGCPRSAPASVATARCWKWNERTRCQVSGVRCQVRGVRCQVTGVRCQVTGVRCQVVGRGFTHHSSLTTHHSSLTTHHFSR